MIWVGRSPPMVGVLSLASRVPSVSRVSHDQLGDQALGLGVLAQVAGLVLFQVELGDTPCRPRPKGRAISKWNIAPVTAAFLC